MRLLCPLSELADVAARGFDPDPPGHDGIVVVRGDGVFHAYLNRCPHLGLPLDWLPGRFLDSSEQYLQCANHGALFRIADGYCVAGPCAGERLVPVRLVTRDAGLWLDEPAAGAD